MPTFADAALDAALAYIATNGTALHFCTSEPATYAAVAGVSLGSVTPSYGAAADHATSGRRRTVTPGAGTYAAGGTAAAWALTNGSSILVATGTLTASRAVNSGDAITASAFEVSVADPVAV